MYPVTTSEKLPSMGNANNIQRQKPCVFNVCYNHTNTHGVVKSVWRVTTQYTVTVSKQHPSKSPRDRILVGWRQMCCAGLIKCHRPVVGVIRCRLVSLVPRYTSMATIDSTTQCHYGCPLPPWKVSLICHLQLSASLNMFH